MTWRRYDSSRFAKQWTLEAGILGYKHFAIAFESGQTTYIYANLKPSPNTPPFKQNHRYTGIWELYLLTSQKRISCLFLYRCFGVFLHHEMLFVLKLFDSFVQNTHTNVFAYNSECAFHCKPMQRFRIMCKWYENI